MTAHQRRATASRLRRLKAKEQKLAAELAVTRKRIEVDAAELAEAEASAKAKAAAARVSAAVKAEMAEASRKRREERAARAEAKAQAKAKARAERERREAEKRGRKLFKLRATKTHIRELAVHVAAAAAEHYGTPISSHAILERGGTGRVLAARTALIWLIRFNLKLSHGDAQAAIGWDMSSTWRRCQRSLPVESAAIVHGVLKRLVPTHEQQERRAS